MLRSAYIHSLLDRRCRAINGLSALWFIMAKIMQQYWKDSLADWSKAPDAVLSARNGRTRERGVRDTAGKRRE